MWIFWNAFKSFFLSKEEAQINAKKSVELKDEWCEKSWEYEKPLIAIINLLRDEDEDWIDVNKLQSLLDEKKSSTKRFSTFSKKIWTYKLNKSDFPWFEEFEDTNNLITIYLNFKMKLIDCYTTYQSIYDYDNEFLSQVDKFDGNWLDEWQDKMVWIMNMWMEADLKMKDIKDLIEDFEGATKNSHEKTIILNRVKKEFDVTMNIGHENTENEWKAIKLYEEKKRKINPNWEPKR